MSNKHSHTNVTLGGGYKSNKSTALYTPDNAPINFQETKEKDKEIPRITLEADRPNREINFDKSFLESISSVYISGNYPVKGHTNMKIKEIVKLIVQNTGGYKVRVIGNLKSSLIDIISFGDSSFLGRKVSKQERDSIIKIFASDNI
jgi:hypothetical protein